MNTKNNQHQNQLFYIIEFIIDFLKEIKKSKKIIFLFYIVLITILLGVYFSFYSHIRYISEIKVYQVSNNELLKIKQLEKIRDISTIQHTSTIAVTEDFYYNADLAYENFLRNLFFPKAYLEILSTYDDYNKLNKEELKNLSLEFLGNTLTDPTFTRGNTNLKRFLILTFSHDNRDMSRRFLKDLVYKSKDYEKNNLFNYIMALIKTATQMEENKILLKIELTKKNIEIAEDLNIKDPIVEKKIVIDQFEIRKRIINLAATLRDEYGGLPSEIIAGDQFLLGSIYLSEQLSILESKFSILKSINATNVTEDQIFEIFNRTQFKNIFPGFKFNDFFAETANSRNLLIEPVVFDVESMITQTAGKQNFALIFFTIFIISTIFISFFLIMKIMYAAYKKSLISNL